ncbi:methyltransferase domain-containing protein [Pseudonocardia humida]|uniref:Methyltransferase domain-containing protein n=1 Tax=Pseudonocardia humida TaxID=2800819 RepID=A0ABT1A3H0_9PSEU|nr:methyltransferase domain-containing protein [Pseudonocardia humida]MCO1657498.1 methyltransferase domain-containing protein [Pseudonocardia humida]
MTIATPPNGPGPVLALAVDRAGRQPPAWLAAPLQTAARVLEISPGGALLRGEFTAGGWLGLDIDDTDDTGNPAGARVRADPRDLPVRSRSVDGVALLLALPSLPHLDPVFAELRRVLRPGGTLVVGVPSAAGGSWGERAAMRVLRPVHRAWPHRSALDRVGWLLAAADFAVMGDDRVPFAVPIPDAAAALALAERLPSARLWPPNLPEGVRAEAASRLARRAGPDRVLPVPMRRLVARR